MAALGFRLNCNEVIDTINRRFAAINALRAARGDPPATGDEIIDVDEAEYLAAFAIIENDKMSDSDYPQTDARPTIMDELSAIPQWVCWKYEMRPGAKKPTKPPINPFNGHRASSTDPKAWTTLEGAWNAVERFGCEGVGFVLTKDDHYIGIDLDHVLNPQTGEPLFDWVKELIERPETYCEVSPSGEGIRMIARGKIDKAYKDDKAQVEIYADARYVTITGDFLQQSPAYINPAQKTLDSLIARVEDFRRRRAEEDAVRAQAGQKEASKAKSKAKTKDDGDNFFRLVNNEALANIAAWLPSIFPRAKRSANGAWRIASNQRGRRDLQEDISVSPDGIVDFGLHDMGDANEGRRTAIDIVIEFHGVPNAQDAALWLCERLNIDPASIGWRGGASAEHTDDQPNAQSTRAPFVWPELDVIPESLPSVPPFDPAFLPEAFRPWAVDIAHRMQAPLDYVGVTILVEMCSLVGSKMGIRLKEKGDWMEVANIWGCVVGSPGTMKSPAIGEALKPLKRLEIDAVKAGDEARARFERELAKYTMRKKAAESKAKKDGYYSFDDEEPQPPPIKRYIVNDSTYEALAVVMADNPQGVLVFRDELITLLKSLDDESNAPARGFYLESWNGTNSYSFDRIMRGRQHVDNVCSSLFGATQPGRLREYIKKNCGRHGENSDGLIERFGLLVWPDSPPKWEDIDEHPNVDAKNVAYRAFNRLAHMSGHRGEYEDYTQTPFFHLDDGARRLFKSWHANLEKRVRDPDMPSMIQAYLSKQKKLVPALALAGHLADSDYGPVSEQAMSRAIAIADYAEAHILRCYTAATRTDVDAANAIIRHIKKGDLRDGFTLRDVHRPRWSGLADHEDVEAGINLLIEYGWIRSIQKPTGGRPVTVFEINPGALK